jgi:hypothetical protein
LPFIGVHRYITVYKRSGSTVVQKDARLVLDPHMRQSIAELLEMYPITSREKEDLNSERERSQTGHKNIGYLNTTIPQIPNTQINPEVAAFKKSLPVYLHNDQIINTINLNQVSANPPRYSFVHKVSVVTQKADSLHNPHVVVYVLPDLYIYIIKG